MEELMLLQEHIPKLLLAALIDGIIGLERGNSGGVIFTQRNDNEKLVRGLTSVSIVFCLAAIGISIGLGYYGIAVVTAILIELNVFISRFIKKDVKKMKKIMKVSFKGTY